LENNPKINAAIKSVNAGLQLFGNNFALVELRLFPFWGLWWLDSSVCFAACSEHH